MKRIKLSLAIITAIALCANANAEELKKAVLGIEAFTYSRDFSEEDAQTIRSQIINAIQNTGRVIVADHNSNTNAALRAEAERRKQESAMDANTVAEMTSLNANSILTANLDQLVISKEIYEDFEYRKVGDKTEKYVKGRYPYLKATITYSVKITDCETGSVQCQETYQISSGSYSSYSHKAEYSTPEEAHKGILNKCVNQDTFSLLILNTFKAQGKILQVEEGNAKSAKTVYVSLGADDGIAEKQILEVYKEIDIAGEISRKLIGEVDVVEILGSSRCLAKVKKGGDVIQQVIATGGSLPVQSRSVQEKFFGGIK